MLLFVVESLVYFKFSKHIFILDQVVTVRAISSFANSCLLVVQCSYQYHGLDELIIAIGTHKLYL